ncbi:MAG: hypothetical protein L6R00_19110 [Phycisphaerae bacterium]|nr:hypothetical protein [Phycisphaerae bacterium]
MNTERTTDANDTNATNATNATRAGDASSAGKRTLAEIASLIDWFECELAKQDDEPEATWPRLGTLTEVRERLMDALALFSGFDRAEIQRSLDELRC